MAASRFALALIAGVVLLLASGAPAAASGDRLRGLVRRLLQNPDLPQQRTTPCWMTKTCKKNSGRHLLQNPDLPQQRVSNPCWMTNTCGAQASASASASAQASAPAPAPAPAASGRPLVIYQGGQLGSGWTDSSYGVGAFTQYSPAGRQGGTADCHYIPTGAATSFYGPQGSFSGRTALEFWVYAGSSQLPDVAIVVSSPSADCNRVQLSSLSVAQSSGGWNKYYIPLSSFACGPSAGQLVKVDFRNPQSYKALLCLDSVYLD